MKKIRIGLIFLILFLIIYFFIILCNRKNELKEDEIIFYYPYINTNESTSIKQLITEFEKKFDCNIINKGIPVKDYYSGLQHDLLSGNKPDVFTLDAGYIPYFADKQLLKVLNKDSVQINNFLKLTHPPAFYNNILYAVPWIVSPMVLYYNKSLLSKSNQKLPDTFRELIQVSGIINLDENAYGFGAIGNDPRNLMKVILPFIYSNSGHIITDNKNFNINSWQNQQALVNYIELSRTGIIETRRQLDALFISGNIGFYFSDISLLEKIQSKNPKLKYGISLIPGNNNSPGISYTEPKYFAINKNCKKEIAVKFIKFMAEGKNTLNFLQDNPEIGFPASLSGLNDKYYTDDKIKNIFIKQLQNSRTIEPHKDWNNISLHLERSMVEALYGRESIYEGLKNTQNYFKKIGNKK